MTNERTENFFVGANKEQAALRIGFPTRAAAADYARQYSPYEGRLFVYFADELASSNPQEQS